MSLENTNIAGMEYPKGDERTMADTSLRHVAMLSTLPRAPRKIDTRSIQNRLAQQGFRINLRSIQRDLDKLSRHHPIMCDERSKPFGWSWMEDADVLDLPGMDPSTALTFYLAKEFMEPLLPRSSLKYLEPYFRQARNVLDQVQHGGLGKWPNKIKVVPEGKLLIPPALNPDIIDTLYTGLLEGKQLKVSYCTRGNPKAKEYLLHPLGMVFRDRVIYLVVTARDYQEPRHFALHRFKMAELLDANVITPKGFSLDQYVDQAAFDYPVSQKPINIKLLFDHEVGIHLEETPIHKQQKITQDKNGRIQLTASVNDTQQLRWWLLGFGDKVEVKQPASLRKEFRVIAENMRRMYQQ